jgi:hypothetical protein
VFMHPGTPNLQDIAPASILLAKDSVWAGKDIGDGTSFPRLLRQFLPQRHVHSPKSGAFPLFSKLPIEIRMMIWKYALPGPRIVDIRLLALKKTQSEWDEEHGQGVDPYSYMWDEMLTGLGSGEMYNIEHDHQPDGKPALIGARSYCRNPSIIFVNKEAHEVAAKNYQKAFSSTASVPETYFDFENDTLYIPYPKLNARAVAAQGLQRTMLSNLRKLDPKDTIKVKKLAILPFPGMLSHRLLEDEVAELLLSVFPNVEIFTIVADHHDGCKYKFIDRSPISFVEPVEIHDTFNSYWTTTIPENVEVFDIPRPRASKRLASVIITTEEFHAAMQRKDAAMRREAEESEVEVILPPKIKIPSVDVMVAISQAILDSPEEFLVPPPQPSVQNVYPTHRAHVLGDIVSRELPNQVCGKTVQPGMYLQNFKEVVGPVSSSYVEMSWPKYLALASAKFVEYAENARKLGQAWWN